jgi:uncharacterized protein (TIGR03435 family)
MKRAVLYVAGLFLVVTSVRAQPVPSIVGTWQGTLSYGANNVRALFIIDKQPDGSLHGGLKWIDSDGVALPLSSIEFTSPDIIFAASPMNMTYHGTLSADGNSIAGTWTQGKQSRSLTLTLATPDTLWKHAGPGPMAADADPAYEVASIKPALPEEQHPIWNLTAPEFHATGMSAAELIKIVYKVRGRQLINMAPWVADSKFDITAKPDTPGAPSEDQTRIMIRKLLTERFHLICHTGTQDYPALVMTLDPKGPRPTLSDPALNARNGLFGSQQGSDLVIQLSGADMPFILKTLMDRYRDKQIVDETGLTGRYDVTLRIPGGAAKTETGNGGTEDEIGVAYLTAAEKAGFKFTSKRVAQPVVIIDHIDPPTPN